MQNKGFIITIFTVIIPLMVQFFFVRYASYEIDKEVYGNYVLIITFTSAMSAILLTSPATAFQRYFNESSNKERFINEFRTLLIPINIIGIILIILFTSKQQRFDFTILLMVITLFFFMSSVSLNKNIILQKMRRKRFFFFELLDKFSRFLFPAVGYFITGDLKGLLSGFLIGYGILFIYSIISSGQIFYKFTFYWKKVKIYFLYSYPTLFMSLFGWIITFSDRYFIDFYNGPQDVAIYSLLSSTAGFSSILGSVYAIYVNPKIYKYYSEDKTKAVKLTLTYLKILGAIFISVIPVFFLMPKIVFTILLEKEVVYNTYYYHVLFVLVCSSLFNIYQTCVGLLFNLIKKMNVLIFIWLIAAAVNIIGNLFVSKYGIIAAGLSTAAAYFIILGLGSIWLYYYFKKTNIL